MTLATRPLLLVWAVLGLMGCQEPPQNRPGEPAVSVPYGSIPETSGEWRDHLAEPGIEGITPHFVGNDENQLLLIEFESAKFEPVLIAKPGTGISSADALRQQDLAVVLGSGFVAELRGLEPVGLLQVQGETLNPVQGYGYTRILGINDQGIGVVHRDCYQRDLFHSALQAGPGIIEEGKLDISEADLQRPKYFRSFMAVCANRWVAGVSLAPTHLRTLGQTLTAFFEAASWQCNDVVNLAGDRQAVLLVATGDGAFVYHGDPETYKASLLGFRSQSE